jgi:hypothetical protein
MWLCQTGQQPLVREWQSPQFLYCSSHWDGICDIDGCADFMYNGSAIMDSNLPVEPGASLLLDTVHSIRMASRWSLAN